MLDVGDGHDHLFRGMRQSARPAGAASCTAAPAAAPTRPCAASTIRATTASSCSISAAAGARRRTPRLEANTTWHLVADMERLREAARHRALAAVRRLVGLDAGARLCRDAPRARQRADPARHLPAAPRRARLVLPGGLQLDLSRGLRGLSARHPAGRARRHDRRLSRRLTDPDREVQLAAARAWSVWEGIDAVAAAGPRARPQFGADAYALAFARIECHYFVNGGFFAQRRPAARAMPASCATSPAPSCTAATTW